MARIFATSWRFIRARESEESRGSEADQTAREVLDRSKTLFLALLSLVFFVRYITLMYYP
jgi:hypothetical protein